METDISVPRRKSHWADSGFAVLCTADPECLYLFQCWTRYNIGKGDSKDEPDDMETGDRILCESKG